MSEICRWGLHLEGWSKGEGTRLPCEFTTFSYQRALHISLIICSPGLKTLFLLCVQLELGRCRFSVLYTKPEVSKVFMKVGGPIASRSYISGLFCCWCQTPGKKTTSARKD